MSKIVSMCWKKNPVSCQTLYFGNIDTMKNRRVQEVSWNIHDSHSLSHYFDNIMDDSLYSEPRDQITGEPPATSYAASPAGCIASCLCTILPSKPRKCWNYETNLSENQHSSAVDADAYQSNAARKRNRKNRLKHSMLKSDFKMYVALEKL